MAKKRGNGEGSIGFYNGRWVARVTMADGKRKAIYGKSRAEVARKLAIVLRDRDAGLPTTDGKTTVKMLLSRWLEESVKVRNRPSTQQFYQSITQTHLIPDLGDVKLVDLTPQHVERMLAAKLKAGLAPTTVSRIRATLRRALSMAEKHGLVHRNVASLADPPKITPRLVEPMSKAQARTFLDAIRGHRLEALFVLALTTGPAFDTCRQRERPRS